MFMLSHSEKVLLEELIIPEFEFSPTHFEKIELFASRLIEMNARMNLVGKNTLADFFAIHLLDGLLPLQFFQPGLHHFDLGSGGGIPAILWAIVFPNSHITCIESTSKKAHWLQNISEELELPHLRVLSERLEDVSSAQNRFDSGASRAVRLTPKLLKAIAELLEPEGQYLYFSSNQQEWQASQKKIIEKNFFSLPQTLESGSFPPKNYLQFIKKKR